MSATLQQIEANELPPVILQGGTSKLNADVRCVHRRSQTLLCSLVAENPTDPTNADVFMLKTYSRDRCGRWHESRFTWKMPTAFTSPPVAVVPIESMNVFLVLCSMRGSGLVMVIFIDLEGKEVNRYDISHMAKAASCCDIDQNRKELVIASRMKDGGRLQSYSLRCIEPTQQNTKRHYIAVFRLQAKLSEAAGRRPLQVCTQDVGGATLILTDGGGITAVQTGTLEQLWFVPFAAFKFEPRRLWVDKFGSDFVVYCVDKSSSHRFSGNLNSSDSNVQPSWDNNNNNSSVNGALEEILELWHPPVKFAKAEAGEFSRGILPLDGSPLTNLAIETQSPHMGTFIVYMTVNGAVRLWRKNDRVGSATMDPVLVVDTNHGGINSSGGPVNSTSSDSAKNDRGVSTDNSNTHHVCVPGRSDAPDGSGKRKGSLISFLFNSSLPDTPISVVVVHRGNKAVRIALHPPSDLAEHYRRKLLELSVMTAQTRNPLFTFTQSYSYDSYAPSTVQQFFAAKQEEDEIRLATMQRKLAATEHADKTEPLEVRDDYPSDSLYDWTGPGLPPLPESAKTGYITSYTAPSSSVPQGSMGATGDQIQLNLESRQGEGDGDDHSRDHFGPTSVSKPTAEGAAALLKALGAEIVPLNELEAGQRSGRSYHSENTATNSHDADSADERPGTNYLSQRMYSEFDSIIESSTSTKGVGDLTSIAKDESGVEADAVVNDDKSIGSMGGDSANSETSALGPLLSEGEVNNKPSSGMLIQIHSNNQNFPTSTVNNHMIHTPPVLMTAQSGVMNPVVGAVPLHLTRGDNSHGTAGAVSDGRITDSGQYSHPSSYYPSISPGEGSSRPTVSLSFTPLSLLRGYHPACDDASEADGIGLFRLLGPPSTTMCEHGIYLPPSGTDTNTGSGKNDPVGGIVGEISNQAPTALIKRPYDASNHAPCTISDTGLIRIDGTQSNQLSKSILEVSLSSLATRMCALGVVTTLNQGYLFDLRHEVEYRSPLAYPSKPLMLELNIRARAKASAILAADVAIGYQISKKMNGRMQSATAVLDGQLALCLFGDSDGMINFAVCNRTTAIQTASFRAHNQVPVVAVVTTGHASLPVWRVKAQSTGFLNAKSDASGNIKADRGDDEDQGSGVGLGKRGMHQGNIGHSKSSSRASSRSNTKKNRDKRGERGSSDTSASRLIPVSCAGSAMVTLGKDGEVKVWQPRFADLGGITTDPASIFTVANLTWSQVGMFTCRVPMEFPLISASAHENKPSKHDYHADTGFEGSGSVPERRGLVRPAGHSQVRASATAAALDPSCVSILVSFSDGSLQQWPLPGLLSLAPTASEGSAQTTQFGELQTTREPICIMRGHRLGITHLRGFVAAHLDTTHASNVLNTQVDGRPNNSNTTWQIGEIKEDLQFGSDVGSSSGMNSQEGVDMEAVERAQQVDPIALHMQGNGAAVRYSFKDLRKISEQCSLVSSGRDYAVVLWSFTTHMNHTRKNQFLSPIPIRQFVFSGVPTEALCFAVPIPSPSSHLKGNNRKAKSMHVWRLSAVSSGTVVTAFQGTKEEMFHPDDAFISSLSGSPSSQSLPDSARGEKNQHRSGGYVDPVAIANKYTSMPRSMITMVPLHAHVDKASLTAEILSKRANFDDGYFIWEVLDSWTSRAVPDPINLTSQQFALDPNVTFDGVITAIPSSGHAWEPGADTTAMKPQDMIAQLQAGADALEKEGLVSPDKPPILVSLGDNNNNNNAAPEHDTRKFVQDGVRMSVPADRESDARLSTATHTGMRHRVESSERMNLIPTSPSAGTGHEGVTTEGFSVDIGVTPFQSALLHQMTERVPLVLPPTVPLSLSPDEKGERDTDMQPVVTNRSDGEGGFAITDETTETGIVPFNDSVLDEDSVSLDSAATAGNVMKEEQRQLHELDKRKIRAAAAAVTTSHADGKIVGVKNSGQESNSDKRGGEGNDAPGNAELANVEVIKTTRAQQLREKKLAEMRARDRALPGNDVDIKERYATKYVSKPRKTDAELATGAPDGGTRQISGNAVTFTVPMNFDQTQREKAENKYVVDKGQSKARRPNNYNSSKSKSKSKDHLKGHGGGGLTQRTTPSGLKQTHDIPQPVHKADTISLTDAITDDELRTSYISTIGDKDGDADAAESTSDDERDDELGPLGITTIKPGESGKGNPEYSANNPFYFDRNAKSIFYRNNVRKAPAFIPRSSKKPFVDPSLIPEVDDRLSLLGAELLNSITDIERKGLDILVEYFSEKDMDAFENMDKDSKLQVLDEIGLNVVNIGMSGHEAVQAVMVSTLKDSAKDRDRVSSAPASFPRSDTPGDKLAVTGMATGIDSDGVTISTANMATAAAKKGLSLMKRLILKRKAEMMAKRKGGTGAAILLADPDTECDVLLQQNTGPEQGEGLKRESAHVTLTTPNLGAIAVLFAMEIPKRSTPLIDGNNNAGNGDAASTEEKAEQNPPTAPEPPSSFPDIKLLDTYKSLDEVLDHPAIAAASELKLPDGKNEHTLTLSGLKPGRQYKAYAFLRCTNIDEDGRTFKRMTVEEVQETEEVLYTAEEQVNIAWQELNDAEKDMEIRAAMRCSFVIAAVDAEPGVHLITEMDFAGRDPNTSSGRAAIKKIEIFAKWWAPKDMDSGLSAVRKQFLFYESLYALCNMDLNTSIIDDAASVSVGSRVSTSASHTGGVDETKGDNDAVSGGGEVTTAPSGDTTKCDHAAFTTLGLITPEKLQTLKEMAKKILDAGPDKIRSLEGSDLAGNRDFFNFQSWYKGGQELVDYEETLWKRSLGNANNVGGGALHVLGATKAPNEINDGASRISSPPRTAPSDAIMSDGDSSSDNSRRSSYNMNNVNNEGDAERGRPGGKEKFVSVMPLGRRSTRAQFLRNCYVTNVDIAAAKVSALIETYKVTEKAGLGESDLTLRRSKLSEDEIEMIMKAIKLNELCIQRGLTSKGKRLDPSMLGRGVWTPQNIANADIFAPCDLKKLVPDAPPQLTMACLPGTNRRPIRAWQLCTVEERNLELCIACSFDYILETAIDEGIPVPDPEDVDVDPRVCLLRASRWTAFSEWYAGQEGVEKVPGAGIPTLARVLVAEQWERRMVLEDFSIMDAMVTLGVAFTDDAREFHTKRCREVNAYLLSMREGAPVAPFTPFPTAIRDELMVAYEQSLAQNTGVAIRMDMLRYYADTIIRSRAEEALRILWPPGPAKLSHQFLFPRLGLMVPPIELPPSRIKLFPSVKKDSYTYATIAEWYSQAELEEDDEIMREYEEDGRRRRAYLEWLAKEDERMEESRILMLTEDKEGLIRREYFRALEAKFSEIQDLSPDYTKKDFSLQPDLPGRYDKTFTDRSVLYEHGTGIDNEDELEDIKEAMQKAFEEEQRKEEERKAAFEAEMKRRADEAAEVQRKEEMDRRLAENTERRRQVREHIEALQRKRRDDAIATERKKIEGAKMAALKAEQDAYIERKALESKRLEDQLEIDRAQMEYEDAVKRDYDIAYREIRHMEHEDILGSMRAKIEQDRDIAKKERLAFLKEIYTEHVPFAFDKTKIRVPAVHSILSDDFYEETHDWKPHSSAQLMSLGAAAAGGGGDGAGLATSLSLQDFAGSSVESPSGRVNFHVPEAQAALASRSVHVETGEPNQDASVRSLSDEIERLLLAGLSAGDTSAKSTSGGAHGPGGNIHSTSLPSMESIVGHVDDPILGELEVDTQFVRGWVKGIAKQASTPQQISSPLRGHLLETIRRRTTYTPDGHSQGYAAEKRRRKTEQHKRLRSADQQPVLWKGLSEDALELLAQAKARHDRATGKGEDSLRPYTANTVLTPIQYSWKDRDTRVAENKAALLASRPISEHEIVNPELKESNRRGVTAATQINDEEKGTSGMLYAQNATGKSRPRTTNDINDIDIKYNAHISSPVRANGTLTSDEGLMFESSMRNASFQGAGGRGDSKTANLLVTGDGVPVAAAGTASKHASQSNVYHESQTVRRYIDIPDTRPMALPESPSSSLVQLAHTKNHLIGDDTKRDPSDPRSEKKPDDVQADAVDGISTSLSKSLEAASIVMQKSRIENHALKGLTVASLSANDNYDRGKRVHKPSNAMEARNEPNEVITAIKQKRSAVKEYVSANAVMEDKFYLQACEPGTRDRTSLDESVEKFMEELKGDLPSYGLTSAKNMKKAVHQHISSSSSLISGETKTKEPENLLEERRQGIDGDLGLSVSNEANNMATKKPKKVKKKRIISNREVVTPLAQVLGRGVPQESYYDKQQGRIESAVMKNLKGKPNDPARFEDARYKGKYSGVPAMTKGFGILGGNIDISANGHDPRLIGNRAANSSSKKKGSKLKKDNVRTHTSGAGGDLMSIDGDSIPSHGREDDLRAQGRADIDDINLHSQSLHLSPSKIVIGAGIHSEPSIDSQLSNDSMQSRQNDKGQKAEADSIPNLHSYDDEASIGSHKSHNTGVDGEGSLISEKTPVSIVGVEVKKQGVNILSEGGPASTPQTPVPATPNEADAVAKAVNTEQVTHKSLNTPIKLTTVTLEGV